MVTNLPSTGLRFQSSFNELDMFAAFFLEMYTQIIGKYIVLHEGDKSLMVLRPYQFYAMKDIG